METIYYYADSVWVEKRMLMDFIDFVEPRGAFAVEDMGEDFFAVSLSNEDDLRFALRWAADLEKERAANTVEAE